MLTKEELPDCPVATTVQLIGHLMPDDRIHEAKQEMRYL